MQRVFFLIKRCSLYKCSRHAEFVTESGNILCAKHAEMLFAGALAALKERERLEKLKPDFTVD